jgi:hypothetical protein
MIHTENETPINGEKQSSITAQGLETLAFMDLLDEIYYKNQDTFKELVER